MDALDTDETEPGEESDQELELNWMPTPPSDDPPSKPRKKASGSLLGAAMLGVGEVIEPEKTRVEIQQEDERKLDDEPFELDFGALPPLN